MSEQLKIVTLVTARHTSDRIEFGQWYLNAFAPQLLRHCPSIDGLAVNLVNGGTSEYADPEHPRTADVYTEFRLAKQPEFRSEDLMCAEASEHMYRVQEMIELDRRPPGLGRMAGIKMVTPLFPLDENSIAQTRVFWDAHVPLALRIHIGMSNYVREWVEEPLSQDPLPIFGIASMHFPTVSDLQDRLFDSAESVALHGADIARFVGSASPMLTTRYVLK